MISFDNWGENTVAGAGGGSDTISFTNSGNILLAACMLDSLAENVTTVGYNANVLTQLYSATIDSTMKLWVGYILNPTIGTNNLVFNFSGSVSIYRTGCISFFNVLETDPIGGDNSTTRTHDNTKPISTTVTVQDLSGMVVAFSYITRSLTSAGNANAAQTEKMNNYGSWSGGENHVAGISYLAHAGSNTTMTWESWTSGSGANNQQQYAVELRPIGFIPQINLF